MENLVTLYLVNTIAAEDLSMPRARASADMSFDWK